MEKLEFKTLTKENDIQLFLRKVENYTGIRLPPHYASHCKIVGGFLHNKMAAGYMLVTSPEYRSLIFVPDQVRNSHSFFRKNTYEMMEVNGLWIGPALKTPKLQFQVWAKLIKDIFYSRKKYVLLLRNSRNRNMQRFLNMANPISIYEGAPQLIGDEKTHESIQVSYTTRWKIVLNAHRYFREYFNREKRATKFTKNRKSEPQLDQSRVELA